jgi:hypothetical protein
MPLASWAKAGKHLPPAPPRAGKLADGLSPLTAVTPGRPCRLGHIWHACVTLAAWGKTGTLLRRFPTLMALIPTLMALIPRRESCWI